MPPLDSLPPSVAPAEELHGRAVAALEAGDAPAAAALLRRAVSDSLDLELLNDLAVVCARLGESEQALALLEACLAIDAEYGDAAENLAALRAAPAAAPETGGGVAAPWRASPTLGGPDPDMPERAFPGMPHAGVMAEHTTRYSYAQALIGNLHVLDLGCGTGYGSEMLSWTAASVRGFDLWRPDEHERPVWPGGAKLTYGHDLCRDPLPRADAAVMFEVIEHLADAPAALRRAWTAVDLLFCSFPNPEYHGSHLNPFHVNDWSLDEFERQVTTAATVRFSSLEVAHLSQPGPGLLVPGRDPSASYWLMVVRGA